MRAHLKNNGIASGAMQPVDLVCNIFLEFVGTFLLNILILVLTDDMQPSSAEFALGVLRRGADREKCSVPDRLGGHRSSIAPHCKE